MQFNKKILATAVVVAAAAGWFAYLQVLPVAGIAKVARGTALQAVPANVIVQPEFVMEIKSEHGGRIGRCLVKKGQEVKAGDTLIEIDPQDLQLEIERIEVEYNAAKARIELGSPLRFDIATAEENVRNNARMFDTGRLAQVEFDRTKRNLEVLKDRLANEEINNKQTLATYENTLKQKRRSLEKMKITAPADGTVIQLEIEPGALVGGGQTLARVISKSRLVEAQISEENFAGVRSGLPVAVQFLGYYGQRFVGKVESVLASADEKTKRYTAYLNLEIAQELLTPGLTGEASITINQRDNALKVERRSLVGNKLYIVRSGRVHVTPVEVGFSGQKFAEILSGIKEGESYILDDLSNFKDGQRVRTVEGELQSKE
jgi:RND family efflux transporter MFP subunit